MSGGDTDASVPSYENDITRDRAKAIWKKEECDMHTVGMKERDAAGYWLLSMPEHIGNKLKKGRQSNSRHKGVIKICKPRRQGDRKVCLMHVRLDGAGIPEARYCQLCGNSDPQKAKACCSGNPIPWQSFASLPYCEYCGARLKNAQQCGECKTTEVPVLFNNQPADRPIISITETAKAGKVAGYKLDTTQVTDRLELVVPECLSEETGQKTTIVKKTWKCEACGTAIPGKCRVTGKMHDPPLEREKEMGVDEYTKIDEELDFQFKRKPDKVIINNVVRAMQAHPNNKWNLHTICNAALESERLVRLIIGKVAAKVDDRHWQLLPQYHK